MFICTHVANMHVWNNCHFSILLTSYFYAYYWPCPLTKEFVAERKRRACLSFLEQEISFLVAANMKPDSVSLFMWAVGTVLKFCCTFVMRFCRLGIFVTWNTVQGSFRFSIHFYAGQLHDDGGGCAVHGVQQRLRDACIRITGWEGESLAHSDWAVSASFWEGTCEGGNVPAVLTW